MTLAVRTGLVLPAMLVDCWGALLGAQPPDSMGLGACYQTSALRPLLVLEYDGAVHRS